MSAQSAIFNPSQTTSAASGDGFSVPRLTTTGRLAISFTTADKGMMVYDTTLNNLFIWNGTAWESVPASGDAGANGSVQYNDNGIIAGAANLQYDKAGGFTSLRSGSALRAYVADNSVYSTISDLGAGGGLTIDNLNADGISLKVGSVNTNVLGAGTATWYDGAGAAQMTFVGSSKKLSVTNVDIWRGLLNDGTSTAVGATALAATIVGATGNTAVGNQAMYRATTGANNVAVGSQSLSALPMTGNNNVAVGLNAGAAVTSASNVVGIGNNALNGGQDVTGADNIGIGNAAMYADGSAALSGSGNVGVGVSAARRITTGNNNVAVGPNAMFSVNSITGSSNVAVGTETLRDLSSGVDNIAIGRLAGNNLTSGSYNIAIGLETLRDTITGSDNIAIGDNCLVKITGNDTVAIGTGALQNATSAVQNVAVGRSALQVLVTGNANTAIGFQAISTGTGGANNTAMGVSALYAGGAATSNTAIGFNSLLNATGSNNTALGSDSFSNVGTGTNNIGLGVGCRVSASNVNNELSIGSSAQFVATNGGATTYFPTASAGAVALPAACLGFIRIYLNASFVKIPVYGN